MVKFMLLIQEIKDYFTLLVIKKYLIDETFKVKKDVSKQIKQKY